MQKKNDGVIEAVRYNPDGKIALARLYQRQGSVWSDLLLVDRDQLTKRLEQGRRYVTGKRKPYFGNTFDFGHPVSLVDGNIISEGKCSGRDHLAGIPLF